MMGRSSRAVSAWVPALLACALFLIIVNSRRSEAFRVVCQPSSASRLRRREDKWLSASTFLVPRHVSLNTYGYSSSPPLMMSPSSDRTDDDDDNNIFHPPQHVVIAGAGIMGVATAYYLAKNHPQSRRTVTIVDPSGRVAPAASGKAGGFLAKDWNDGSPTEQLTRRSFQLHQDLANSLDPDTIQYRRLSCVAVSVADDSLSSDGIFGRRPSGKKLDGIEWAQTSSEAGERESAVTGVRVLGGEETIAQVHPKLLCERLWEETRAAIGGGDEAATLVHGRVVAPIHDPDSGTLTGVRIVRVDDADDGKESETVLPADALLFACGPWTTDKMLGIKYHSVVVPTPRVLTQCVFFSGHGDPEVYVRPDGTAYCTGFPEDPRVVDERPGHEQVLPESVDRILISVRRATGSSPSTGALAADPVLKQACYLPSTRDGIPVMGLVPPKVAGGTGVYVCAGHTCWGILLGPASGEAMASLVATGKCTTVDLRRFDPIRLGAFQLLRR